MACSVYAAQYLLEGLFERGTGAQALALITAPADRSWRHMLESGTTITWEAWDQKYKPNQDWNHAWGAAPANLLPRFLLGAQPLAPGWRRARIRPIPGRLARAAGTIPTPRGPVQVAWTNEAVFTLTLTVPPGMTAQVELPAPDASRGVFSGGSPVRARRVASRWLLDEDVTGSVTLEVR
jgi:alpha-L-rhamnosidase